MKASASVHMGTIGGRRRVPSRWDFRLTKPMRIVFSHVSIRVLVRSSGGIVWVG